MLAAVAAPNWSAPRFATPIPAPKRRKDSDNLPVRSWPGLSRPSTSLARHTIVEGARNKWGHDVLKNPAPAQPHLRQHGAAEQPIGVRQRLQHFEMVVGLADQYLDRLAGRFDRRGKVAGL